MTHWNIWFTHRRKHILKWVGVQIAFHLFDAIKRNTIFFIVVAAALDTFFPSILISRIAKLRRRLNSHTVLSLSEYLSVLFCIWLPLVVAVTIFFTVVPFDSVIWIFFYFNHKKPVQFYLSMLFLTALKRSSLICTARISNGFCLIMFEMTCGRVANWNCLPKIENSNFHDVHASETCGIKRELRQEKKNGMQWWRGWRRENETHPMHTYNYMSTGRSVSVYSFLDLLKWKYFIQSMFDVRCLFIDITKNHTLALSPVSRLS